MTDIREISDPIERKNFLIKKLQSNYENKLHTFTYLYQNLENLSVKEPIFASQELINKYGYTYNDFINNIDIQPSYKQDMYNLTTMHSQVNREEIIKPEKLDEEKELNEQVINEDTEINESKKNASAMPPPPLSFENMYYTNDIKYQQMRILKNPANNIGEITSFQPEDAIVNKIIAKAEEAVRDTVEKGELKDKSFNQEIGYRSNRYKIDIKFKIDEKDKKTYFLEYNFIKDEFNIYEYNKEKGKRTGTITSVENFDTDLLNSKLKESGINELLKQYKNAPSQHYR